MGTLAIGSVVLVPFPFSDLSQSKRRPAVILAPADRGDWILCQITSNSYSDSRAVRLENKDFDTGALRVTSYVRPAKLFTAHESLFVAVVGSLNAKSVGKVSDAVVSVIRPGDAAGD